MKTILYPFAFIASWLCWLPGHVASILMDWFDSEAWCDFWFVPYQACMLMSSFIQESVGGESSLWPWMEPLIPDED